MSYLVAELVLDPLHAGRRIQVILVALRKTCRLRQVAAENVVGRHAEVHLLSPACGRPAALECCDGWGGALLSR